MEDEKCERKEGIKGQRCKERESPFPRSVSYEPTCSPTLSGRNHFPLSTNVPRWNRRDLKPKVAIDSGRGARVGLQRVDVWNYSD